LAGQGRVLLTDARRGDGEAVTAVRVERPAGRDLEGVGDLKADELGAVGLVVVVEPVGIDQAQRVVGRVVADGGEEGRVVETHGYLDRLGRGQEAANTTPVVQSVGR